MAEPAVFHVQAFEHGSIELLAGALVGLAVGVAAAGGEVATRSDFKDTGASVELKGHEILPDAPTADRRPCHARAPAQP
ncbi:MAG: hypothetical protein ACLQIJ_04360 [Polyangia bacterium]